MSYTLEKLFLAIYELTIGEENIKERLKTAYLHLSAISEEDFPNQLKKDWASIYNRLTKIKSKHIGTPLNEGNVQATLFRMHKKTASKIAADIVNLHSNLEGYFKDGDKNL